MNAEWYEQAEINGPTGVDHELKKKLVVDYGERYDIYNFVETGTAHGDLTQHAASNHYDLVHTIDFADYPPVATLVKWAQDNNYSFSFKYDDFILESNEL